MGAQPGRRVAARRLPAILLTAWLAACGGSGDQVSSSTTSAAPSSTTTAVTTSADMTTSTEASAPAGTTGGTVSAGTGSANGGNPDGGSPVFSSTARFHTPTGIAADKDGNLYVSDRDNYLIRKIAPSGAVTTIAGTAGVQGAADGLATTAQFTALYSITVADDGSLYFVDQNAVRKLSTSGMVSTVAGAVATTGDNDGAGAAARFSSPGNLAVDHNGNVYVADGGNDAIRKIAPNGMVSTVYQGSPLTQPSAMALDPEGNLIIGDAYGVYRLTGEQTLSLIAGVPLNERTTPPYMSRDGTGTSARFYPLHYLTVQDDGTIFVTETDSSSPFCTGVHSVVRKISPQGMVATIAGVPMICDKSGSSDGVGTAAQFYYASGITAGKDGNLYVADSGNQIIRRVTPDGVVTTIVGKAKVPGYSD